MECVHPRGFHLLYLYIQHMNCARAHGNKLDDIPPDDLSSHVCSNIKMKILAELKDSSTTGCWWCCAKDVRKIILCELCNRNTLLLSLSCEANCLSRITQQIPTKRNKVNNRRRSRKKHSTAEKNPLLRIAIRATVDELGKWNSRLIWKYHWHGYGLIDHSSTKQWR